MPSGISCQLTRIINGTVLIEYALGILLFPSTILQLSAHDKICSAFNNSFVAILSIDESKNGPSCLDHLGLVVLGVFASYARLRDNLTGCRQIDCNNSPCKFHPTRRLSSGVQPKNHKLVSPCPSWRRSHPLCQVTQVQT